MASPGANGSPGLFRESCRVICFRHGWHGPGNKVSANHSSGLSGPAESGIGPKSCFIVKQEIALLLAESDYLKHF
jgi:hypothetical protein